MYENAAFAEACAAIGVAFIGPTPDNIRTFGLKHEARARAQALGVRLAPGTPLLRDADAAAMNAQLVTWRDKAAVDAAIKGIIDGTIKPLP